MTTKRSKRKKSDISAKTFRFAIIVSRFNGSVTGKLLRSARDCFRLHGVSGKNMTVFYCRGAFELPQVANELLAISRWDAVVCLGAVIRGETPHFEYVAAETARGIQDVALRTRTPVVFGVLTTDTEQQAHDRAGGKHGDKGWDVALTALQMAALYKRLRESRQKE